MRLLLLLLIAFGRYAQSNQIFLNDDSLSDQNQRQLTDDTQVYKSLNQNNLTYFVIPHSHTEAGKWLTFNVYYHGRVRNILTSTFNYLNQKYRTEDSLNQNKEKFIWSDFAFFMRWWNEDTISSTKDQLKQFIERGIFSLENGAPVQHDESLSDYKSIIMMFDSGLQFINETFGVLPKLITSIDAYGHSSISPYLYHYLGYEGIVVNRMPNEMSQEFKAQKKFFFTWEGDNDKKIKVYRVNDYKLDDLFNLDKSKYSGDSCFKENDNCAESFIKKHLADQIFQDDSTGHDVAYQMFGGDFSFQQSPNNFGNVHLIIKNLMRYYDDKINIKFATFTDLHKQFGGVEAGREPHLDFSKIYKGDMLPYDESNGDAWTGFYGSRPELKSQIKQIFNYFKGVETLFFVSQCELERLKTIKMTESEASEAVQKDFQQRLELFQNYLNLKIKDLQRVRNDISILLHHDAIAGTCSQAPEQDYFNKISQARQALNQISYDLTERLSRAQIYDRMIDFTRQKQASQNNDRSRGEFQVTIFNPLPRNQTNIATVMLLSNSIKVLDLITAKEIPFDLHEIEAERQYKAEILLQMKPFELRSLIIRESQMNTYNPKMLITEEQLSIQSAYDLSNDKYHLTISFDITKKEILQLRFKSRLIEQEFQDEELQESVVFYPADNTHSCIFLFNPKDAQKVLEDYEFVNITQKETKYYKQVRFNYMKLNELRGTSRLSKIFTLSKSPAHSHFYNISYEIQSFDNREIMVQLRRSQQYKYRVYTDNSAFHILRTYDEKNSGLSKVGKQTYPFVNGIIWDTERNGNLMNIVTNRPGGVSLKTTKSDTLDFFLTRSINNVNWEKGLQDKLEDSTLTRFDLLISLKEEKDTVLESRKHNIENQNENFIVIQAQMQRPLSPYDQPIVDLGNQTALQDFELIDFVRISNTTYLRLRNQHNAVMKLSRQIMALEMTDIKVEVVDESLAAHCLTKNKNLDLPIHQTSKDQQLFAHRELIRFETTNAQALPQQKNGEVQTINFKPFEIKCLRVEFNQHS
ncbi:alpha-mannosidase [Stylonychia lemnae]|uniref:Alpha-mannosidase n=1 Tax=Stylonychia lemnae TaxID=5949 RepID=A0A077ZWD3_STYLE|nr:alpha-mannosidase [Stylonychia lemnae]|eukprot:CDW74179.1 alpha-mannosidase [Stylonychia lemnae]